MSSVTNVKYTIEQYELCVTFKTDNIMTMSAQFLPTGQHFLNENIQLMRIKKDTVIATLQHKSQKNLRCNFQQIVDKENKYLVIKFIVSFDFLPQFSEQVQLEYVEKKQSIKNMQTANFKADIEIMERMIDAYQKNGTWKLNQVGNVTGNSSSAAKVQSLQVSKGKYLMRVSGVYTSPSAQMGAQDTIIFTITVPGKSQKIKSKMTMNSYSGYSYPFAFEQILQTQEGDLLIEVSGQYNQWTLTSTFVIIYPIASFK